MPTIKEVALKAGVSPTTVSHVINHTRYVSPELCRRVQAAMEELGYQPNILARSLRRGETLTIGLILPDSSNPYFAEIGRGIEAAAFEQGYSVMLCNSDGDLQKERRYVQVLTEKQVDGIIFVSSGDTADGPETLLRKGLPVVLLDRDLPGCDADVILVDNFLGGCLATRHLIELGHTNIACISGPNRISPSQQRSEGYKAALQEAGIRFNPSYIKTGDFHIQSGYHTTLELLETKPAPTAIFVCNDLMAIGALHAAAVSSVAVPQALSVVGFDDIELACYTYPRLTTIHQPKSQIGSLAVQILLAKISGDHEPCRRVVVPVSLVVRQSTGRLA